MQIKYSNVKKASKVYVQMYFGKKKGYRTVNKILKIKPTNIKGGKYTRRAKFQKITYQIKVKYKGIRKPQYSAKVTK